MTVLARLCRNVRGLAAAVLAILWMGLLAVPGQAAALVVQPSETSVGVQIHKALASQSQRDHLASSPALTPVYHGARYYRCDRCRSRCYRGWRIRCGTSRACRRGFVRCMRFCWRRYCRY